MSARKNDLYFQRNVGDGSAFVIPAGTWHNLINTGESPLKTVFNLCATPTSERNRTV